VISELKIVTPFIPDLGKRSHHFCFSPFLFFYARKQLGLLLSARLSHRNSVRPSVCLSLRTSVRPTVTRVERDRA